MSHYEQYNDEELIVMLRKGESEVSDYLMEKYKEFVRKKARTMYLMGGDTMYQLNLTGPIGLVIGNEGEGVSRLVREACDFTASIPMKGDIDSLNASVAAGVLAYEIVRQRLG